MEFPVQESNCSEKHTDQPGASEGKTEDIASGQSRQKSTSCCQAIKNYFSKFKNWISFLTLIAVAVYTAITYHILQENYSATIASTRAWVVPTGAYFDGQPKAGFNVRLKLTYENIGKEAASDFTPFVFWSPGTFPVKIDAKQMPYIDIQTAPWPIHSDIGCRVDPSNIINRRAVYPSTKNEFITYGFNDPPYLPQGVVDGTAFFSIFGCLVYRSPVTADKLHHSPFCLYYQPKRGGTIKDGTFEFCPSGTTNAD
jgi:hypothetical protein